MFGNLKEKLINVSKSVKLFSDQKPSETPPIHPVNLNAGGAILNKYQRAWEELHADNETNGQRAAELAATIADLHRRIEGDHRNITDMIHLLSDGSQSIVRTVEECSRHIEGLMDGFETVEKGLLGLENLIENLELQEKQLEHRFQLALYKERKLANLETLRKELASKHAQSMVEHELQQKQILQERQQAFQEAFQTDLQMYKEAGVIPKIEKQTSSEGNGANSPVLEEIQLDCDPNDLETFLEQQ